MTTAELQELATNIRNTLDSQGALAAIKAQLRAAVLASMENQPLPTGLVARQWTERGM